MATMQDYVGGAGLATGMVGWLAGWLAAGPVHGQAGGWRWKWLLVRSRALVLKCSSACRPGLAGLSRHYSLLLQLAVD